MNNEDFDKELIKRIIYWTYAEFDNVEKTVDETYDPRAEFYPNLWNSYVNLANNNLIDTSYYKYDYQTIGNLARRYWEKNYSAGECERQRVKPVGNGAKVNAPKSWIGKEVIIIKLE